MWFESKDLINSSSNEIGVSLALCFPTLVNLLNHLASAPFGVILFTLLWLLKVCEEIQVHLNDTVL